jgi:hypothetical protein
VSRTLKLVLLAALAEMALVAAVFIAAHWQAISHLSALDALPRRRLTSSLFGTLFDPIWLALGGVAMGRQLAQRGVRLAPEHRRFYEASFVVGAVFLAVIQAWSAFGLPAAFVSQQGLVPRLTLVFCGVFAAVYGNFSAKVAPPSGPRAPAPAVWIRGMLRNGWAMVLLGLFEVVAAIALPSKQLPLVLLLALPANLLIARSQLRLMWPSHKPRANA